jgi:hypothetical protein
MLGSHVTLEINKSLGKSPPAVGTDDAGVRAVILEQMLDEKMLVGKLLSRAAGTFQKIFTINEEISAWCRGGAFTSRFVAKLGQVAVVLDVVQL